MILLFGGTGYIGSAFQRRLTRLGVPYVAPKRSDVPMENPSALDQFFLNVRPWAIINAVGFTGFPNVDDSERQKLRVLESNLLFADEVATTASRHGVPLGHVSTGCIYMGSRPDGSGFRETDPPNFTFRSGGCSFYSGTKALAEEWIVRKQPECWIWRLRRPFNGNSNPKNYLCKMAGYRRFLKTENSISHLDEFINAALDSVLRRYPFGVYHICNPGVAKTSDIVELMQAHGMLRNEVSYFNDLEEFKRLAGPTPRSECILDSSKIIQCGSRLRDVHEALEESIKALSSW